jgi:hypothetical protein
MQEGARQQINDEMHACICMCGRSCDGEPDMLPDGQEKVSKQGWCHQLRSMDRRRQPAGPLYVSGRWHDVRFSSGNRQRMRGTGTLFPYPDDPGYERVSICSVVHGDRTSLLGFKNDLAGACMEGGALVIFFIFVFVLTRKIYTHLVAILKFCLELPSLLGLYIYSSSGEVDCFPC